MRVVAARNILPMMGWSTVSTEIRNLGDAPAKNVQFTVTLPPELQPSSTSGNSLWPCDFVGRVATCTYTDELAPGATHYPLFWSTGVGDVAVGSEAKASATVTTSSPEGTLANNTSEQKFTFVGKGVVKGRFWHDLNADGVRQDGEPNVDPGMIVFQSIDDEDQYGYANTHNGTYDFQVPAKKYRAEAHVWPSDWKFTTPNVGDDATDSDFTDVGVVGWYRAAYTDEFVVQPDGTITVDVGVIKL